ncbi:TPA: LOW QUALITY PROTEIN: hypothetical protein N0F65_007089, partial [Lagenidium giganteum]
SNGTKCKRSPESAGCWQHPAQEIAEIMEDSNIETSMAPNHESSAIEVETNYVGRVDGVTRLDIPSPSETTLFEASSAKIDEIQDLDESTVIPMAAEGDVYMDDDNSESELNNSMDETTFFSEYYIQPDNVAFHDVTDEMAEYPLGLKVVLYAANAHIYANEMDIISPSLAPNQLAYELGYRYCHCISQGEDVVMRYYCKSLSDMMAVPKLLSSVDTVPHCLDKKLYDSRTFGLCSLLKRSWFRAPDQFVVACWILGHKASFQFPGNAKDASMPSRMKTVDTNAAIKESKNHLEKGEPFRGLTETKLKQIASAVNPDKYKEWKDKYDPALPPKQKEKEKDSVDFTDNCLLRIQRIAALNSVDNDFLIDGLEAVDTMLEEDLCHHGFNQPILGYKKQWQQYSIQFPSDKKAAAMLAMTIDHYIILMGNAFLYRCGLDSGYSNDVLQQAQKNPLDEITIKYYSGGDYKQVKALRLYEQHKALFSTYEEYSNQWGHVEPTKFSTCVPFKGNILESVDHKAIEPFLNFVKEIIADNDDELFEWLIKWIAHIYKYPNSRTRCALTLLSKDEGTGKGTFCDILTYLFGIHNTDTSAGSVKSLVSERSAHLMGKKLAIVQEMRENKGDYMGFVEALKSFITDEYIAVRPLYANKMTVRNLVELIITSNNENILKTSTSGRRFTVAKLSSARKQDNAYFGYLKSHCQTQSFLSNFATYLMGIDVKEGSIKALATQALVEMAEASQGSIQAFWSDMKLIGGDDLKLTRTQAYESYKNCPVTRSKGRRDRIFHGDFKTKGDHKFTLEIEIFENLSNIPMSQQVLTNDTPKRRKSPAKQGPYFMKFHGLQACLKTPHAQRNMRSMLVSHAFVDLWRLIGEDNSFDKARFDQLDEQERDFMRYCLNKCKITSRGIDSAYNEQLDSLVNRLKMLEGARKIGDDNPTIPTEMKKYSTSSMKKVFSPIDFSQYECALGSISMYYSWRAITSQRQNNTFKIIWPTASTTTTYTITLPDGTYTANDINNYLQYWSIQNNLYLINNTTNQYYYFISCAENPSSNAIQFTMNPVKNITGWTAASGFPTMTVSSYTPQLQIIDAGFGSIVGYSAGTYTAAQQTSIYAGNSNLIPQIDPTAAVIVGLSNLYNPIANNNQVLHTFTSAGVEYGGLITTSQGQGLAYCPMRGTNSEITISFYDQNMLPLGIIDLNVCIRLLMRPKKMYIE